MLHAWGIPLAVDDLNRKVLIGKPSVPATDEFPSTDWHWNTTSLEAGLVPIQTTAQGTGSEAPGTARGKVLEFNAGLTRTPGHLYEPRADGLHHGLYQQEQKLEDATNFDVNTVVCRARWMGGVYDFPPGALVNFAEQQWLVRDVTIQGHGSEAVSQEFALLDKLMPLLPRLRRTNWPMQCLWAHVTQNNSDDPTKSGRIQVEFDWEQLEKTPFTRLCWLQTVTPYGGLKGTKEAGGTSGFLSLPEVGEHVLVQFLDGWDSDAVVIGSVREHTAQDFVYAPHDTKRWQTPSQNQVSLTTTDKGATDIVEVMCRGKLVFRGEIKGGTETVVMDLMSSQGDRIHYEKGSGPAQLDIFCSGSIYMHADNHLMLEAGTIQMKATQGTVKIDGTPLVMINCGPTSMSPLNLAIATGAGAAGAAEAAQSRDRSPAAGGGTPSGGGTNGPFATQDAAARAALTSANPQSISANREYGGVIYRDTSGQYYYTGPVQGSAAGFDPSSAPAPSGTQVVGDYHTHGDYSMQDPVTKVITRTSDPARDNLGSDNFSREDKIGIAHDGAGNPAYRGYLGTPSGTFRRYNPATGQNTPF